MQRHSCVLTNCMLSQAGALASRAGQECGAQQGQPAAAPLPGMHAGGAASHVLLPAAGTNRTVPLCFTAISTGLPTDWWSRPEFVSYNLNIGSVIAAPAHDEVLRLPPSSSGGADGKGSQPDAEATYTLRGFAHTGACT